MNCFEWHNQLSDLLDGTLKGEIKQNSDIHLKNCTTCNNRHEHYLKIVSTFSNQKRIPLPISLRKHPLSPFTHNIPHGFLFSKRKIYWQKTPWYIRTSLQTFGVFVTALIVLALIPKIKKLYEKTTFKFDSLPSIQFKLDEDDTDKETPLMRGNLISPPSSHSESDVFSGENEEQDIAPNIPQASLEIWRFNIKTDNPHEFRFKIIKLFSGLGLSEQTLGLGGIEAPGGIQFDIQIPENLIKTLKEELEKLIPNKVQDKDSFTWYKNKAKKQTLSGKIRVVIWLSQI